MLLLTPAQMAELDRRTIEELGIPGLVLMESAAGAVVRAMLSAYSDRVRERGVVVLSGPGNNGADGLAIARRLRGLGVEAEVALFADPDRMSGDAASQLAMARSSGVPIREVRSREPLAFASRRWSDAGVLVDALFGTGLARRIDGVAAGAVEAAIAARACGVPVIAVDIPSGVDGGSGSAHGPVLPADLTVTFGAAKVGHMASPGRSLRGRLVIADIGIPVRSLQEPAGVLRLAQRSDLSSTLGRRDAEAHKGTFGHLLVIAGGPGTMGAARLCAEAALRAGAGLVTLAIPAKAQLDSLHALAAEVMLARVPGSAAGALSLASVDALVALAAARDAVALGPGIGTDEQTIRCVRRLVGAVEVPTVIDADGLNCLALSGAPSRTGAAPTVLTPHPGEMARLVQSTAASLAGARLAATRQLAAQTGAVVLLKGAGTITAAPDGRACINPTGNPGMATAGSGDVLTGIVGALLASGAPPFEAAVAAAFWHGAAGDVAASVRGQRAMIASDITGALGIVSLADDLAAGDWTADPPSWTPA